jgi:uracil-DNA glycosylase
MNEGYNPEEIKLLREECEEEGTIFMHCDDEDESMADNGELAHVQFVGTYKGQEVIYDAIIYTLRLHHSSLVYEKAVEQAQKVYPKYLPLDERTPNYKITPEEDEEAEELITELIESIEEEEEVKVKEHLEIESDFEYGVGLDACLNVEAVTDEVITKFINEFNSGTLKLDTTLYSFSSADDDEE